MHISETVSILGLAISRTDLSQTLRFCEKRIQSEAGGYICFVNVHSLTESLDNKELRRSFESASVLAADGMPLVWRSRLKGEPIESRVCGPDVTQRLLKEHPGWHYGLIGGEIGQSGLLREKFELNLTAYAPPFRDFSREHALEDWEAFLDLCPDQKPPRLVFVALGAPKQEIWMREISRIAPTVFFLGVGAALDFLSGNKKRAPRWMQRSGLEWFHRLGTDRRRLWKRYLVTNSRFLYESAKEWIRNS
jgi:N-acetylglucosaminyldiphosphoundecaprenol N-acetyl-beta-D-mannosaminyltransferase